LEEVIALKERKTSGVYEKILEATIRCLAETGSKAVSLRDIANLANVALSQIHYYFENKESLLIEASSYAIRKGVEGLREELSNVTSVVERIKKASHYLRSNHVLGSDWQKVYFDLLVISIWNPNMAKAMKQLQEELVQVILAEDMQIGIRDTGMARLVLAALDGLALQFFQGARREEIAVAYGHLEEALITLVSARE
jgi:AcrR family transcriptional regulator